MGGQKKEKIDLVERIAQDVGMCQAVRYTSTLA